MPVQETHDLTFAETTVAKRYTSWDRSEPDREWAGLTMMAEHAPGLAPRPVRREVAADGSPVVVMSRLRGTPLGSAPLTPAELAGLGAALRRLHDVPAGGLEAAGLGERRFGPTVARASIRKWAADEPDLGPCRDPALVVAALTRARDWLAAPADGLDRVLDPVLGLADGNIGNVVCDGTTCRLVDFEDCGLSDPAFEVADLLEHLSVRVPVLVPPEQLVAAVGLDQAQRARCAAYRPLFAAFWLVMLLPGNRGFPRNPAGTTEDQARHLLALLG